MMKMKRSMIYLNQSFLMKANGMDDDMDDEDEDDDRPREKDAMILIMMMTTLDELHLRNLKT
jgi:hypothetical protein